MIKLNNLNSHACCKNVKKKIYKGSIVLGIASIALGSLSGCGEKILLSDSVLYNTVVAKVDGNLEILRPVADSQIRDNHCIKTDDNNDLYHAHFQDIVSGEYITGSRECYSIVADRSIFGDTWIYPHYKNITDVRSITFYLTEDELKKVYSGEFTKEDELSIINRIYSFNEDEYYNKKSK